MGYVIVGLAALTSAGIQARDADVHPRHDHGALFTMVGLVYARTHTPDHPGDGRARPKMPFIAAAFVMAGLASLGLPGMNGFIGEFLVFIGAFEVWPVYTAISAFAIVLTAGYITWMLMLVFFGRLDEHKWHGLTDADAREKLVVVHARDHHPDGDVPQRRLRRDRGRRRADRAAVLMTVAGASETVNTFANDITLRGAFLILPEIVLAFWASLILTIDLFLDRSKATG